MEERRSAERYQVPLISLRVKSEDAFRARYLRDLSTGGVFIRSRQIFEPGTPLRVALTPPGETEALELGGRVTRVELEDDGETPRGMAVQFDEEQLDGLEALRLMLERHGVDEADPMTDSGLGTVAERRQAETYFLELHDEIESLERLETEQRALVESLLREKNRLLAHIEKMESEREQMMSVLSKATGEGDAAKRELWELSADLAHIVAEAEARAKSAEDSRAKTEVELEQIRRSTRGAESENARLREELDAATAELKVKDAQAAHLRTRLARASVTERELRRLLAVAAESGAVTETPAPVLSIAADDDIEIEGHPQVTEGAYVTGTDTEAAPGFGATEPVAPAPPLAEAKNPEEPHPGILSATSLGASIELDLESFKYLLESGAQIEPTQRFQNVTVMDRDAVQLASLLERHFDYRALSQAAPRTVRSRLVELLFGFHSRGQITLGPVA